MSKPKVLELFAGSCTFSKEAERLGCETFRSDYKEFEGIDYAVNILDFDIKKVPFKPDIIWASPPCTTFSVMRIGSNWNFDNTPKNSKACLGLAYAFKTVEIIKALEPKYWYIENPRGKLRKLNAVEGLDRATVWYCQYGENRAKPTDIWSNNIRSLINPDGWQPRPECSNGNPNCHHDRAPRGVTTTGTQGLKDNYHRSILPLELCTEIITQTLKL